MPVELRYDQQGVPFLQTKEHTCLQFLRGFLTPCLVLASASETSLLQIGMHETAHTFPTKVKSDEPPRVPTEAFSL